MILALIITFSIIGSILSLFGSFLLLLKKTFTESFSKRLVSFAAGVLIATAFLDLLPEALEEAKDADIFLPALIGFASFFLAERFFRLFHFHHAHDRKTSTPLILIGDGVHNFVDGITITAAFLTSIPLGVTASFAVAAHEIPQEIADMGVLLANGLSKKKALFFNFLSALTALAGALIAFFFATFVESYLYFFLALAAGHFIYIAASDLIPELHEKLFEGTKITQAIIFVVGILAVFIFKTIFQG